MSPASHDKVGAQTEAAMKEKKDRVDDALHTYILFYYLFLFFPY